MQKQKQMKACVTNQSKTPIVVVVMRVELLLHPPKGWLSCQKWPSAEKRKKNVVIESRMEKLGTKGTKVPVQAFVGIFRGAKSTASYRWIGECVISSEISELFA